jgi:hypothetical protein
VPLAVEAEQQPRGRDGPRPPAASELPFAIERGNTLEPLLPALGGPHLDPDAGGLVDAVAVLDARSGLDDLAGREHPLERTVRIRNRPRSPRAARSGSDGRAEA